MEKNLENYNYGPKYTFAQEPTLISAPEDWHLLRNKVLSGITCDLNKIEAIKDFMFDYLDKNTNAIGISAPQLRLEYPCFAFFNGGRMKEKIFVWLNDFDLDQKSGKEYASEGCMSFPNMKAHRVPRFKKVILRYQTFNKAGKWIQASGIFKDFSARVIQHEIDHIYGVEMWDRAESVAFPENMEDVRLIYKYKDDYYLDGKDKKWFYSPEPLELTEEIVIARECIGYKF